MRHPATTCRVRQRFALISPGADLAKSEPWSVAIGALHRTSGHTATGTAQGGTEHASWGGA